MKSIKKFVRENWKQILVGILVVILAAILWHVIAFIWSEIIIKVALYFGITKIKFLKWVAEEIMGFYLISPLFLIPYVVHLRRKISNLKTQEK